MNFSTIIVRGPVIARCSNSVLFGTTLRHNARAMSSSSHSNDNYSNNLTKIGFIGLGNMGYPMCRNLAMKNATANTQILAFDANEKTRNSITSDNHTITNNIQMVHSIEDTSRCDIIITMLPGCEPVNHVMSTLVREKTRLGGESKTVFIDCSTVNPSTSKYWSEQVSNHNIGTMVDAPVSGGVKGAIDGTLTFMVGNGNSRSSKSDDGGNTTKELSLYEFYKIESYLLSMGKTVKYCGKSGTGSATKLCNNLALACQMIGICEAMNLGEALEVDPVILAEVMNTSTAKCWSCEINNPHPQVAAIRKSPASNRYAGGFSTKLMLKDLSLALAAAQEIQQHNDVGANNNTAVPMGTLAKELYQMVNNHGHGNLDFGYMLQFLKNNSGGKAISKK